MKTPPAPPGPFRPAFWRSPLRGPWLTATLGSILLVLVTVVAVTGFASHSAYQPDLPGNAIVPVDGDVPFLNLGWPTHPSWLYALTQGAHVVVGFVAVPLLLAKLWSVIPRLFAWPPAASPAQAIERAAIALLVGSALFEFATGILNAQTYYPFPFGFVRAHYYGACVFVISLTVHVLVKLPVMRGAWRVRGVLKPLSESLAETKPERATGKGLAPVSPAAPTLSRRGLLAGVGAGSLGLFLLTAGQAIGGPLRGLSLLSPRGGPHGADGPGGFPVNKTARAAHVTPQMTGSAWRLELGGGSEESRSFTREDLLGMDLHTDSLPIACVEGWSATRSWTGVKLADLADLAGAKDDDILFVESVQRGGAFSHTSLSPAQIRDPRSLLALKVEGRDLPLDHGYPARIIVPALPGVHNTKWVGKLTFRAA